MPKTLPEPLTKKHTLRIRLDASEMKTFDRVAAKAGLRTSTWARWALRQLVAKPVKESSDG